MSMNYPMIDLEHLEPDTTEARRIHERYYCNGIRACFRSSASQHIKSVNNPVYTADVTDISLDGLALSSDKLIEAGEFLSVEIETPGNSSNEKIHAQVMWTKVSANENYIAGLKVIAKNNEMIASDIKLVCSHCDEASFYLEDNVNSQSSVSMHSCCRCGHSHYITDVIAKNRLTK